MKEYIEKEAFKLALYNDASTGHYGEFMDGSDHAYTHNEVCRFIDRQPAAGVVERKRGEWDAKVMKDIGTYTVYWCSECNCVSYFKHNFCPNCGADMREVEHE